MAGLYLTLLSAVGVENHCLARKTLVSVLGRLYDEAGIEQTISLRKTTSLWFQTVVFYVELCSENKPPAPFLLVERTETRCPKTSMQIKFESQGVV